ncbi:MAG: hypothetical protein HY049_13320 [Acidobacteria bacterium]|nr:hypothetical protein [Acidobacteriota bacterium]
MAILGTTEAAARAVAAAAGTLDLLAVAAIAFALAGKRAALAAAALMAFSPWAFHLSRVGFQATLLPLLLAAGAAALLKGGASAPPPAEESRPPGARPGFGWILLGAALLTLALYTYVAAKIVVPILLAAFCVTFRRRLASLGARRLALLVGVVTVIALPVVLFTLTPGTQTRASDVGLMKYYSGADFLRQFLGNYAGYFSPRFLVTDGDPIQRHQVAGFGELHAHDLLFLLAGLVAALRRRSPADLFLTAWLFAGPIPAALTIDPRHAIRSIATLPAIYALAGAGVAALFGRDGFVAGRTRRGIAVAALLLVGAILSTGLYLQRYFVDYPKYSGPWWQYGFKEALQIAMDEVGKRDAIYVTPKATSTYVLRLYLFAFPPAEFQKHGLTHTKYFFDPPPWDDQGKVPGMRDPIFILTPAENPGGRVMRRHLILNRTAPRPSPSPGEAGPLLSVPRHPGRIGDQHRLSREKRGLGGGPQRAPLIPASSVG